MEKFLNALSKPAKWIFVIGGFFYAMWFAIMTATGFGNGFVSVIVSLIIMTIGTALLVAAPLLVLLKKDNAGKMVFLFLLGYWVLTTIQNWLGISAGLVESNDGLAIVAGLFSFIAGLGVVAVLVLTVLELILKKPALRFVSFLVFLGVIIVGFFAGLFLVILSGMNNAFWPSGIQFLIQYMILPIIICFGYIYFMGLPNKKQD